VDWQQFLFSTAGRLNRAKYWLAALIYSLVIVVAVGVGTVVLTSVPTDAAAIFLYVGGGLLFLLLFFSGISVAIKRLHDRDKSGWWCVPFLVLPGLLQSAANGLVSPATAIVLSVVAMILSIWGIVELGCLRGTIGANPFGDDPLATPVAPSPGPAAAR
jgi:uncharacterized membrane protein YhaH (DUF805 family)